MVRVLKPSCLDIQMVWSLTTKANIPDCCATPTGKQAMVGGWGVGVGGGTDYGLHRRVGQ